VHDAMMQLAQNPVFLANPACLGDFMENLVKSQQGHSPASPPPASESCKRPLVDGSDSTQKDLENVGGSGALVADGAAEVAAAESVEAHAHHVGLADVEEGTDATGPTQTSAAEEALFAGIAEEPDRLPDESEPVDKVDEPVPVDGPNAEKDVENVGGSNSDAASEASSDGKRMKSFVPQASDVHACLLRKTTLDLNRSIAPQEMPGHTSVVMELAGVLQDVWIPMAPDAAVKAGLTLSPSVKLVTPSTSSVVSTASSKPAREPSAHAAAAIDLTVDAAGNVEVKPLVPTPPALESPAPATEVATSTSVAHASPALPGPGDGGQSSESPASDDAEAKASLRNSYMRFHRSVT
ncbi:unnamed protein product, partial [Cladocopium goreaui]